MSSRFVHDCCRSCVLLPSLLALIIIRAVPGMQEQLDQEFDIVSGAAGPDALAQITQQINQQRSLPSILRQLCLLSVSQTVVKPKDWAAVTAALYHSYGHKHMQTLADLEEAGLLLLHEGRMGNVPRLRKRFKLVVADGRVAVGATLFGFKPMYAFFWCGIYTYAPVYGFPCHLSSNGRLATIFFFYGNLNFGTTHFSAFSPTPPHACRVLCFT